MARRLRRLMASCRCLPNGCLQAAPDMFTAATVATTHQRAFAVWQCRLAGLPDLNYTQPEVREEAANWLNWMIGQFGWVAACLAGWLAMIRRAVLAAASKAAAGSVLTSDGSSMCCLLSAGCSTHLLRFDAAGHVQPDVWPWLLNRTTIQVRGRPQSRAESRRQC